MIAILELRERALAVLFSTSLLLACSALLLPPAAAVDLGMSPSSMVREDLLPGSTLTTTTTFSRLSEEGDMILDIAVSGEAASWIEVPSTITIPDGERTVPLTIVVHVPSESPLGPAEATVTARTPGAGEGLATVLALPFSCRFHVTDERIRAFHTTAVSVTPLQEDYIVAYTIANTGNLPAGPTAAALIIKNRQGDLISEETLSLAAEALPFSKLSATIRRPHQLPPETYWLTVVFIDEGVLQPVTIALEITASVGNVSVTPEMPASRLSPPTRLPDRGPLLILGLAALPLLAITLVLMRYRR